MIRFIASRAAAAVPTLILISFLVFMVLRLVPGDPVRLMFGLTPPPEQEIAKIRNEMGLNEPALKQYFSFMQRTLKGDLGHSFRTRQSVSVMIKERLPRTLRLALMGTVIATTLGVALGVLAAATRGSWTDTLMMSSAVLGVSVPSFWLSIMLMLIFSVKLQWLPVAGSSSFKHLILPAVTLGLSSAAVLARVTRSSMLEVLGSDYVRTARAKGLSERVVIYRHALKNAMIPVVTILGLQIGGQLSGALIAETVFGYAGIGQLAVQALNTRDYPVIQGVVLLTAVGYVLVNLVVDLAYGLVDPRIRFR